MQSAFTEIESILKQYDLERENQQLKERLSVLQHVNGGLRGANRKLKNKVRELKYDS
ncbi:hypothetical protein [Gracilimonas sediminicola]|uniref:hypothetical protein n=1 Tax=Gracilimonas sediminicola TaxID=2952158 RepID=UPI0038D4A14C